MKHKYLIDNIERKIEQKANQWINEIYFNTRLYKYETELIFDMQIESRNRWHTSVPHDAKEEIIKHFDMKPYQTWGQVAHSASGKLNYVQNFIGNDNNFYGWTDKKRSAVKLYKEIDTYGLIEILKKMPNKKIRVSTRGFDDDDLIANADSVYFIEEYDAIYISGREAGTK